MPARARGPLGLPPLARLGLIVAALIALPFSASAQLDISGQLDLVAAAPADSLGLNRAFRGDSPYSPVRLRLFGRHWVTPRIGIFTELLLDFEADPRVNGAYVVVNELAGKPWLNARLGLAPNVIGSFGLRSTYFNSNPLIGVPLVWQYRTNLGSSGTNTAAELAAGATEPGQGMPILYDSCWNIQWELLGEVGILEYSAGVTAGSLSNPVRSRAVPGSTWLGRLGVTPIPGLRLGVSGSQGPYLSRPVPDAGGNLPYTADPADFDQTLFGADVEYQSGPLHFQAEAYRTEWEAPLVAEALELSGGFAELRVDLAPDWYVTGRAGGLWFGDVVVDAASAATAPWDQDVRRIELALGHRLAREVLVKLDWQRTSMSDTGFQQDVLAVQLSTVF